MRQKSPLPGPGFALCRGGLLAVAVTVFAGGCAVTSLDGRRMPVRSDGFADYVETVFRRQNDVANELVLTLDAADPGSIAYATLEDAELDLFEACSGLNDIARSRRDGDAIGGLKALRRARRAPDCERATGHAVNLLESDGADAADAADAAREVP